MPRPDPAEDDPLEEAVADPVDGFDPPILSAREAARRGMPGWPGPDEAFPPPPIPVPAGRGGEHQAALLPLVAGCLPVGVLTDLVAS